MNIADVNRSAVVVAGVAGLAASSAGTVYGMAKVVAGLLLVIFPFAHSHRDLASEGKELMEEGLKIAMVSSAAFGGIVVASAAGISFDISLYIRSSATAS